MVKALLDCGQKNCGDDTFQSFYQVKIDLELMLNDPSRFLMNIDITNGLPSLEVCDKLYGRESEIELTHLLYQQLTHGACNGAVIMGESGVGKSKLAMHIRELTVQAGGYFLDAKFDQNNLVNPLSKIAQLFNSLCDLYARDALPAQLKSTEDELKQTLDSEAFRFATMLPSLSKLLPSISNDPSGSSGVDEAALSMLFLVTKLLDVISASLMRPITLFLDDIQWADPLSLSLLGGVVSSIQGSKTIFFTCCCRSDLVQQSGPFSTFLDKAAECSVTTIKLGNMTVDGINHLLSDTFHHSPRITRPLASVLLNKTRGNCLSLLQMLVSLKDQGLVYVDISKPCWSWNIKKIVDLEISHDVMILLVEEMRRLPSQLQLGLQIASCLGFCIKSSTIDILSMEFCINLPDLLRQVSEKGFLKHDSSNSSFSFVHDKIQQAAKELMSEHQRLELHMQLGLVICYSTLEIESQDDELFFMSVNQSKIFKLLCGDNFFCFYSNLPLLVYNLY
jgi:predicted ATPase